MNNHHHRFSRAYYDLLDRGPFPGQIDPWAESGRYFQQIHAGMISHIIEKLRLPLRDFGYIVGRETSLTIAEGRKPDVFVETAPGMPPQPIQHWNYRGSAREAVAETGILLMEAEIPQEGIFIKDAYARLVTVVEIISPSNKTSPQDIRQYREYRHHLLESGVNVVEIDLTRSYTRLLQLEPVEAYAYHALVYLPGEPPILIGMPYGESLKRIALPLRGDVIAIELHAAYDYGYQAVSIPAHILAEGRYTLPFLPFPTLFEGEQQQNAFAVVAEWQAALEKLK
jgi:hypothetical protein